MITKRLLVPKKLVLIAAVLFTAFLTTINFVTLESIPEIGLGFEDKIYHVGVYMVFSFLWAFWSYLHYRSNVLFKVFWMCLAYGIVLEGLQHIINPSRTFDLIDLLSNCTGVLIGIIIAAVLIKQKVKLKL